MAYDRDDRRYGTGPSNERGYGGNYGGRNFDDSRSRDRGQQGYGNRDYGRDPRGYDYQDRGFMNRAGDEVRSWFGDEDADRRRRADERHMEREDRRYPDGGRYAPYGSGYGGAGGGGGFGGDTGGGYSPSDYGAGRGAGATSNWGLGAGQDRYDWGRDQGYQSWRDRQVQQLDQDYDDYRREHQSKFDNEFATWRQGRQGQRDLLGKVQEHQEVVGSDGQHIGTVDHVRGDHLKLTKNDRDAGGHHHGIPSSWIVSVDDKVTVNKTAAQAKAHWRDEDDNRQGGSLFGGGQQSDRTRSYSGNR